MEHDNVLFRRVAHRVEWVGVAFFGALVFPTHPPCQKGRTPSLDVRSPQVTKGVFCSVHNDRGIK